MSTLPVGLQLWTVRDHVAQDMHGTLERVAQLGLQGVEFAGYAGHSPQELRGWLDAFGLRAASVHISSQRLFEHLDEELVSAHTLGITILTCPWAQFEQDEDWLRFADRLQDTAIRAKGAGIRIAYHNHAHELSGLVNGQPVLDALLDRAPDVLAEIDVAWVEAGGQHAGTYLSRYAGRVPLVHLKDYRREDSGGVQTVELGQGQTDLGAVLGQVERAGAEWLILEQDDCPGEPFDSVAQSLAWLRQQQFLS
ncbi:sugar phosphate isomerase/epimerase family protein [Deinococcus oregonensis]|uniref:Sugar phosphate isomerase/epimerase family protein n=1 Tax=Deinococcus oregonensis TaxID=1805970 RepID=A0ABV6AW40_9DEIO